MSVDQNIVNNLIALQLEIESQLVNTLPGVFNNVGGLHQQLNELIVQYPKEALVFINELRVLPYFSIGELPLRKHDTFIKPEYRPGLYYPITDLDQVGNLTYPDGPYVQLGYEYGKLTTMLWLAPNETLDISDYLWLLSEATPQFIDDWSELPLTTLEGILAISKNDIAILNEINLKPVDATIASFDAVKNVFNRVYFGSLRFFALGEYPEPFNILNREDYYLSRVVDKDQIRPFKELHLRGVVKGIRWGVGLTGLIHLLVDIAVDNKTVTKKIENYFQLILQGFCIGTEVNLLLIGEDYYLGDNRHISADRKIYPPKTSPLNGSKLLYEGSNGMTLFLKDVSMANTEKANIVRLLDRNKDYLEVHYPTAIHNGSVKPLLDILASRTLGLNQVEFLYSLGLNGLNNLNANLIGSQAKTNADLISILTDPKKLYTCGVHWTSVWDITNSLKHGEEHYLEYIKGAQIDFKDSLPSPKVVGVVGTLKVTRHELSEYFGYHGIEVIEESLTNAKVVLVGEQTSDYVISNLERLGVLLVPCGHYLDLTLLIQEVQRYVDN